MFAVLLCYFDNVIPDEFDSRQSPWFFLTFNYWGISFSSKETNRSEWLKLNTTGKVNIPLEGDEDSDVLEARKNALDPSNIISEY